MIEIATYTIIFYLFCALLIGALLTHLINYRPSKKKENRLNPVKGPEIESLVITEEEKEAIQILQEEWKVCVESLRHFDNLLIRFRSVALSLLIGGATISFKFFDGKDWEVQLLTFLFLVFWFLCFLLDYFYYFRLLLGGVNYIQKFHSHPKLEKLGYFGLTHSVNSTAKKHISNNVLLAYYLVPTTIIIIFFLYKSLENFGAPAISLGTVWGTR